MERWNDGKTEIQRENPESTSDPQVIFTEQLIMCETGEKLNYKKMMLTSLNRIN
jgi:hypothetical protein